MNRKEELKILNKVYDKLQDDMQDPQMGLSERYFESLVIFIAEQTENNKEEVEDDNNTSST